MNEDFGIVIGLAIIFTTMFVLGIRADRKHNLETRWKLNSGEIVRCGRVDGFDCGLSFRDCDSGREYHCQTNAEQL